ncbi:threonine ammonia-lyase [Actinomadura darangshiensis]|uniref:L-threonine dehydratase catabolic TdcB n=1 Tax=Actinomadura darangshiensis TaxID=705336 RepID=A0A4R5BGR1_9ACTN|nr:threonine ammonia-lyase [Actinomadura darangshiensis]TDD84895.1 threonine ammonia-lyase [Actinomadura darangshiensis]
MTTVSLDDVRAAHDLLSTVAVATPLVPSRVLSEQIGGPVLLKCENLQRTGSFKIRGAYVRIAGLSPRERAGGVVAASAGNHAQGVALAASMLGCKATVFMPVGAPLPKIAATRGYGAEIVFPGPTVDDCLLAAQEYADECGAVFIHPFDHPDVVAGQATIGLEIMEQCPDARTIVVPVGGGGLLAGIAAAAKGLVKEAGGGQEIKLIGAQAKRAAAFPASLAAGRPTQIELEPTMADGIAVGRPGDLTYAMFTELVDAVVTVTEESISQALLLCLERAKQVVEPAGAAGVAALLEHAYAVEPPVVVLLSGGNIDPLLLSKVLRHGLAGAGRYLVVRCRLKDRPGALVTLLGELAELGVNVLDVMHERVAARLHVEEAEVLMHLETRGADHSEDVIGRLREKGYTLTLS